MKSQTDRNGITLLVVRDAGRPVRQLQLSKPMALALPAAAALSISSLVTSMHFHASKSIAELEAEAAALSLSNLKMEMQVSDKDQKLSQLRGQVTELSEEAENIRDRLKNVSELEKQLQTLLNKEKGAASGTGDGTGAKAGASPTTSSAIPTGTDRASVYDATAYVAANSNAAKSRTYVTTVQSVSPELGANVALHTGIKQAADDSAAPQIPLSPGAAPKSSTAWTSVESPLSDTIRFRIGAISGIIGSSPPPQVGGEYIAVHENDPFQLVEAARDDFEEIHSILDEMVNRISKTIHAAREASLQVEREAAQKLESQKLKALTQKQPLETPKANLEGQKQGLSSNVIWPTLSRIISSNFGYRSDPFKSVSAYHSGIDIAGKTGDPVYAALDGEVAAADQQGARGKYIVIKHPNGLETWYMHLSGMNVSPGQKVTKGQTIGKVGSTGRSTGPHLHFQVVKQNTPVNPLAYVKPQ